MKKECLVNAVEWLRELDALELVGEFREYAAGRTWGTYCAMVLDPVKRLVKFRNEPSWSCSADEYFGENGSLSERTMLSCNAPEPVDGYVENWVPRGWGDHDVVALDALIKEWVAEIEQEIE